MPARCLLTLLSGHDCCYGSGRYILQLTVVALQGSRLLPGLLQGSPQAVHLFLQLLPAAASAALIPYGLLCLQGTLPLPPTCRCRHRPLCQANRCCALRPQPGSAAQHLRACRQ